MEISIDLSLTSRSKKWELLHPLWVGWTFTFGSFSWVAFLYIGVRARQRRWVLWGLLYSIPFAYELAARVSTTVWPRKWDHSWEGTAITLLYPVVMALSIYHALRVRKEYLVRLDNLIRSRAQDVRYFAGERVGIGRFPVDGMDVGFGFSKLGGFPLCGHQGSTFAVEARGMVYARPHSRLSSCK